MNKIKVNRDISAEEEGIIKQLFQEQHFIIHKSIQHTGMMTVPLVLSFLCTSIISGVIYDMLKTGIIELLKSKDLLKNRENLVVKLEFEKHSYFIHSTHIYKKSAAGKETLVTIEDVFIDIENSIDLDCAKKPNTK